MATSRNTRPPTSHIAPFGVRMQPDLKERLEASAQEAGRSLNAEIVARLEASFHSQEGLNQIDKDFLTGLVNVMKSARMHDRDDASKEEVGSDIVLQSPDGTMMVFEMKKAPRQYEFPQHSDEAEAGPPKSKAARKKSQA